MPVAFTSEMAELIKDTVSAHIRSRNINESSKGQRVIPNAPSQWAILNDNIDPPDDGITAPTEGDVELLFRNSTSNALERSGRIKTLTHRYEGITLEVDTLVRVKHINGEWMLEAADCGPLGSPPS